MDESEDLNFMVLEYVKKNKPIEKELHKYINEIYFGYYAKADDIMPKYQRRGMMRLDDDEYILTILGEKRLRHIKHKYRKEWVQTWIPAGALIATALTVFLSAIDVL